MKKVYLAGSCSIENRTQMKQIAEFLRAKGGTPDRQFEVYCPFELKIENAWEMTQENWAKEVFTRDVEAINECDYFVMVSPGRISSAGTNWEQGYAYALGKPVYVFQTTKEPTSLMTYCGCTKFIHSLTSDIDMLKLDILAVLMDRLEQDTFCRTVLT